MTTHAIVRYSAASESSRLRRLRVESGHRLATTIRRPRRITLRIRRARQRVALEALVRPQRTERRCSLIADVIGLSQKANFVHNPFGALGPVIVVAGSTITPYVPVGTVHRLAIDLKRVDVNVPALLRVRGQNALNLCQQFGVSDYHLGMYCHRSFGPNQN